MRNLSRVSPFIHISLENFCILQALKCHRRHASIKSKPANSHLSKEISTSDAKAQTETNDSTSLLRMISEIVGTEYLTTTKESPEIATSKDTQFKDSLISLQHVSSSTSVRDNVKESIGLKNDTLNRISHVSKEIIGETQFETMMAEDVSPTVHRITEVIRGNNSEILVDERLKNLGIHFDSEIVEKVLKRCFKVGHLALRFFNWVKLQPGFCHTTETYNTMIYIAGEAKEFDLVAKLVEDMDHEFCPKNINTWTILISHYGKAKMTSDALMAFEKMKKSGCEPDKQAYKSIIRALSNARKAELAMEFYKEMVSKNMEVDMKLYTMLVNCLSAAGDSAAVQSVGDDMIKIAQIPEHEVHTCMLRSLCMSGRIDVAVALFHEIKTEDLTCDYLNLEILVKGLCRAGRVNDALEIVNTMKQNGIVSEKVYGIVINGYLRRSDISKATEVIGCMREFGYLPTVSAYTDIIQHFFRFNKYEKACQIYNTMLENGLEPDSVAITAMIAGHVRHNRISEAWEAFESMKKKGIRPTWKVYSIFIKELCKVSRPDEAFKILNEMWNSKISAGDKIFNLVISSLGEQGKWEKVGKVNQMSRAFKLQGQEAKFEDLDVDHQSPDNKDHIIDVPNSLNSSLSKELDSVEPKREAYSLHDLQELCGILSFSRDWLATQEALEESGIQFTPELVVDTLDGCRKHGSAALRFFSWVGQQVGYTHTMETYNMAIKIAGTVKDFKHMRMLYLEMRRKGYLITANTWAIMIGQYGRAGLTEVALKKFEEMKIDGCEPNGSTYKYILIYLCGPKGRKVEKAIKIFHDMISAGYIPDRELVDIYLACLCEEGKLVDARRCVESLCKCGFAIQGGYSLLAKALCRAGRLEEALALETEMAMLGCSVDKYIYGSLVHGLLRNGRLNEAMEKVNAMNREGISPTAHVYTSLIVHFFKEKQIQKALEIFRKMRADGCEPTVVTYSALIRGYLKEGMASEAWNIFRRMKLKGPFPDFKTYSMFITCLCSVGRSEEALQLIHEMLEIGIIPSCINFRTVFYGLNRQGKQDLAHTVLQTKWALARQRKFSA